MQKFRSNLSQRTQPSSLHVGYGRGAVSGMSVANLLEAIGYQVGREYFISMMPVVKWIFGYQYLLMLSRVAGIDLFNQCLSR